MIRSFLAIEIGEHVRSGIRTTQEDWKASRADVKWVPPENVHLTLKFFGQITQGQVDEIARRLDEVVKDQDPFLVSVNGAGMFPNMRRPRVVWLGIGAELVPLSALHRTVEETLEAIGFDRESRAFRPHLTLGRVRSGRGIDDLARRVRESLGLSLGSFTVDHLTLFRSDLGPTGARYTAQRTFPFGGGTETTTPGGYGGGS